MPNWAEMGATEGEHIGLCLKQSTLDFMKNYDCYELKNASKMGETWGKQGETVQTKADELHW